MAVTGLVCVLASVASAAARAETILAPYAGSTFSGGANDDFGDSTHPVYGATITFLSEGALGFEVDGQYSPNFFGGSGNVASLMGELTIGSGREHGARFFLSGGAGLLKSKIENSAQFFNTDRDSFGLEAGGSLVIPLSSSIGVKGDVRYFRALTNVDPQTIGDIDLGGFHFWRWSGGVAIRL
jgi:hypothetical protein